MILTAACASGQQATLVADAHVSSAQPAMNAGALSNLDVGGGATALMQFNLGVLPAGTTVAQVSRATLRVYCNRADTPGAVAVSTVGGAWSEYGVTFNTMPKVGSSIATANADADAFVTFDVTSAVQAWVAGTAANNGFALSAASAVVQFDSKENDVTSHAPELEIVLAAGSGAGAVGATGATGATGAQGVTGAMGPQGVAGVMGATGAQGLMGATGPTGAAGPAGAQGIAGVTGATGVQGPAGPMGTGLSWKGVYSSAANYAVGDGVQWQGAAWVSLVNGNHGNTPDQSPGSWSMFAAGGAPGVAGATGATGATGLAGANGVNGVTGATGSPGATGVAGSPGLVYRGVYQSATNYVLGDVVVWQGASWASLTAANHGNTPDQSPAMWGVLTSVGAQGVQGVTGATGAQGLVGPQGVPGPAGPQGLQGATGPQGPAGAQGLQGVQGAPGPTGAQGVPGVAGQAGAQGIPGVTGATGAQGPMGATGAQGPVGLIMRGSYNSTANYAVGDGVLWQGAGWVSLANGNHGNTPDQSPTMWAMFSQSGAVGATGAQGPVGPMGATGSQGVMGPAGPQGITGSQGPTGPQGVTGATGATGAAGVAGINFRGAWDGAAFYNVNDAVAYSGSTYIAIMAGSRQQPDAYPQIWSVLAQAGGAGPTGAAGTAATVSVGTVTTLAAGSAATVTNSGTAQNAVLNFGIPQGAQGAAGTGGSGAGSGNFAAMYHGVSYATTYYSVNTPNASATETASVLAWVPQGCTATRLDVSSQQSGNITVTLRTGASLATMADTALACSPAASGSCPALGSVAIPAGNFLDLRIDGASGVVAGVWTAVTCQ